MKYLKPIVIGSFEGDALSSYPAQRTVSPDDNITQLAPPLHVWYFHPITPAMGFSQPTSGCLSCQKLNFSANWINRGDWAARM
jgi:hypothetical protein